MNLIKIYCLLVIFLFSTSPVLAGIYKCPSKNGEITYSQTPCPNGFKKEKGQWSSVEEERKLKREKEIAEQKRIEEETARVAAEEKEKEDLAKANLEKEQKKKEKQQKENDALVKANPEIDRAISGSDDYFMYKYQFIRASKHLLKIKKCTLEELTYMGGWVKSANYRKIPKYFTYCGDGKNSASHLGNKIYYNALDGTVSYPK